MMAHSLDRDADGVGGGLGMGTHWLAPFVAESGDPTKNCWRDVARCVRTHTNPERGCPTHSRTNRNGRLMSAQLTMGDPESGSQAGHSHAAEIFRE